jgi:hypothetical protein
LREPLGKEGSAGNVTPASPQEGFKAGVQTSHRMSWAPVEQRERAATPSKLAANIANRAGAGLSRQAPDLDWMQQAIARDPHERQDAGAALDSGQGYDIDPHAHDSSVAIIRDFEDRLPPGVKIGVLNRVEPTSDPKIVKGLFSDAPDFSNYVRRDFVSDAAAMWDPNTRRIMIARYGTAPFRARRSGVIFSARAFPPRLPIDTAAGSLPAFSGVSMSSSISPVAIFITLTAFALTSAGRFSPLGPLGIRCISYCLTLSI